MFHGRVHGDTLHTGDAVLPIPGHDLRHGDEAVGFVQPHDLEIDTGDSVEGIPAVVYSVLAFGTSVRVELTRTQKEALQLSNGQSMRLRSVQVKVFDKPAG